MACSCKHNQQQIKDDYKTLMQFRELFVKRMTENSETQDARRSDFNQAIFGYNDDGSTYAIWCETDMDMVLTCFDDALRDLRRLYCDTDNCRKGWLK